MNRRPRCDFKMLGAHLLAPGHRNGKSRTPVAKRISGSGELDTERSDQGSVAAFGGEKATLALPFRWGWMGVLFVGAFRGLSGEPQFPGSVGENVG